MNWVLALLAFAGVMAMLSTSVAVAVESLHKVFALRRAGLEEMLRALHGDVLTPLSSGGADAEGGGRKQNGAAQFAKQMTRSPSFSGGQGRWWWLRNIPILNLAFQPRFERLTTLQYVEQLGQTPIGQGIAQMGREKARGAVQTAAYQFERYGQSQSDYFGRRAKVISALVALVVVAGGNVNAFAIYDHLANSRISLGQTLSFFEGGSSETLTRDLEAARNKVQQFEAQFMAAAQSPTADPGMVQLLNSNVAQARSEYDALVARMAEADAGARSAALLALPVGPSQFPYCRSAGPAQAQPDPASRTSLCDAPLSGLLGTRIEPDAFNSNSSDFLTRGAKVVSRLGSWEGLGWLFSIAVTTGLVSLGAPFWFDLFRKLGAVAGRARIVDAIDRQRAAEATAGGGVRNAATSNIDQLTDALMLAAGKGPAIPPSPGQRYGRSTADTLPDAYSDQGDPDPDPGMRQLRG